MAKKIYLQSAIIWAISIGLITAGTPVFLYFAYSNEIGAINITGKSWTDYCTATSWNEKNICESYINFTANEDVFWYPVNYDSFGRSTPYIFDPAVKEWKIERKWGNGWREIPLTMPCTGTWCGAKQGIPAIYSVAWRQGQQYETRIRAIKQNADDDIFWSLGDFDPIWFGTQIEPIQKCWNETTIIKQTVIVKIKVFINETFCSDFPLNKTCIKVPAYSYTRQENGGEIDFLQNTTHCYDIGMKINNRVVNYLKQNFRRCTRDNFVFCCEAEGQSNGNGQCESGEGYCKFDIKDLSNKQCTITKTRWLDNLKDE